MTWVRSLLVAFLAPVLSFAALTRIHVIERSEVLGGRSFGSAGAYERIIAKGYFAVDPKNPANRIITDIDRAPRNAKGLVEFSADLYLLRPKAGNGTLLFEVPNRGGKGMLMTFNFAAASKEPQSEAEFGDAFLMNEGYTLLWIGWQFDVPTAPGNMRVSVPTAGADVRGQVRSDFVLDAPARSHTLGDMGHQAYASVDLNDPNAQLTVRDRAEGKRQLVPRSEWQFAREEDGRPVPDGTSVYLAGGFQPGKIYEVIYTAENPPLVGLGLAAIRDTVSALKYGGAEAMQPNIKRTLGFGISQSGRLLRHYLYQGFNADEQNRQVFDGVWAHVAGAGRGNFNARFAQPSRDARPFLNFFYPVDIAPFTDNELLAGAKFTPKLFLTNGSYEYWGRTAALIHTTPDGTKDVAPLPTTRIYFNTGAQHTNGTLPPRHNATQNLGDPEDYRYQMRALLTAMHAWLKDNQEPPASQYPLLSKGQLVPPTSLEYPKVTGLNPPAFPHKAYAVDYGPDFKSAGLITKEPPEVGTAYPLLVPQVNADGLETSGIRLPEIEVPLGTYTGWNLRTAKQGAPDEMASFIGSYFPFARTKAERLAEQDPRLSIEERYPSQAEYLSRYEAAARRLIEQRYLLDRDLPRLMERARALWKLAAARQ